MAKAIINISLGFAGVSGVYLSLKNILGPYKYKSVEFLTDKTVVITGGTSGIGAELAYQVALRNANLILACRDMSKCQESRRSLYTRTHNINIRCENLDLSSQKSIREFANRIHKKEKKIDVLVHNAAVMMPMNRQVTEDFIEEQLAVNFLGPFLLTDLLSDLMTKRPEDKANSRIVTLICPEYKKGIINFENINCDNDYQPGISYCQSQLARVLITKEFATRLQSQGITVFMVDPGRTHTQIRRHLPYNNNSMGRVMTNTFNSLVFRFPFQGVITPYYCVIATKLNDAATGRLYYDCEEKELEEIVNDETLLKRIRLLAEKWTAKSANYEMAQTSD